MRLGSIPGRAMQRPSRTPISKKDVQIGTRQKEVPVGDEPEATARVLLGRERVDAALRLPTENPRLEVKHQDGRPLWLVHCADRFPWRPGCGRRRLKDCKVEGVRTTLLLL